MGLGDVRGPDASGQAIRRVVGNGDGFFCGIEGDHRQHRAKDFFLGDLHGVGHAVEDGRLYIGATSFFQGTLAASHQLGTVLVASLDVRQHCVHLLGVDQGTDSGLWVQRVAWLPAFQGLDHHWQELVLDRTLDQQARAGGAHFALVEGDGAGGSFGGSLQVRSVGEDDVRALAAGFQPDALHVRFARINHQLLGDLGRTGEYQGVDVHVQGQGLAHGVAVAWQHVQHASRDTGFDGQLGNANGSQRRFFRRLEHYRVTGGQCRAELPAGHQQREVPRYDGTDHTHRFAGNQAELVMRSRGDFVVNLVDGFGSPMDGIGRARYVDAGGVADRLAHVQGFQQRQLFDVLA